MRMRTGQNKQNKKQQKATKINIDQICEEAVLEQDARRRLEILQNLKRARGVYKPIMIDVTYRYKSMSGSRKLLPATVVYMITRQNGKYVAVSKACVADSIVETWPENIVLGNRLTLASLMDLEQAARDAVPASWCDYDDNRLVIYSGLSINNLP